ncbi:hypothetical protein [Thomasclavelia cocleata]|uniref:hypothetical protein n=1 Tax=Thomasclavelia cocleata TaxID=69824 RepID=UPI0025788C38|nr:hypothetical protein [Thomasclavelia cocleata]
MNEKLSIIINKLGHSLGIVLLMCVVTTISFYFWIGGIYFSSYDLNNKYNMIIVPIVIIMVFVLMYFLYKKIKQIDLENKRKYYLILTIIAIVIVGLQIYSIYAIRVKPSWDFGVVHREAISLATKTNQITNTSYFSTYTNNNLMLLMLTGIYKLLGWFNINNYTIASCFINMLMIDIPLVINYFSVKRLFGRNMVIMFMVLTMFCLPIYTYVPIFYTDTYPMIWGSLIVLLYIKINQTNSIKEKYIEAVLIGVCALIGFELKATILILLVAVILHYLFINEGMKKFIIIALVIASFISSMFVYNKVIDSTNLFNELDYEAEALPYIHWVMMGLNKTGGFNRKDYNYSKSIIGKKAKQEAAIQIIGERLNDYGFSGLVKHLGTKINYTYGDGTYYSVSLLARKPINTDSLGYNLLSKNGKYINKTIYLANSYNIFILMMFMLSMFNGVRKKKLDLLSFLRVLLFGLMLFLLIWESKPKYLVNFLPIFNVLVLDGMIFYESIIEKIKRSKLSWIH